MWKTHFSVSYQVRFAVMGTHELSSRQEPPVTLLTGADKAFHPVLQAGVRVEERCAYWASPEEFLLHGAEV